jgi:antitoxin ParD1/3/4
MMGAVRKLDVDVSEALASDIEAAVASGDYKSVNEVVTEALRKWKRERDAMIAELREAWRIGIESGEPIDGNFDVDDIAVRGKARLEAKRRAG